MLTTSDSFDALGGDLFCMAACFVQLFTLRESPPAHSEALPMRADGKWKEEAYIMKQSGQGEEGEEG